MGNQREVKQVRPICRSGFAVPVSDKAATSIREFLAGYAVGHFYTYLLERSANGIVPSLDGSPTELGILHEPHFVIQSGGKMRCGYANFKNHIAILSPYLPDSMFLVGDEEQYIDQYEIVNGALHYKRVHYGGWWDLSDYVSKHFPD